MVSQSHQNSGDFARRRQLPRNVEATLAVMQMGVSDYATIATSLGISEKEVAAIDLSDDVRIRRMAINGVPAEKRFRLLKPLRCPKCRARITVAPCLACSDTPES